MNRDNKNINDYLNDISKDKNQFSIPENYFNSIEDNVLSKIIEEQLPGELNYNVPDDYFESFEATLFSNSEFSKKEIKVISLRSKILKFIPTAAAASMLLFVGLNYFTLVNSSSDDSITSDDLELWMDENYNDYSNSIEFVDTDFTEDTRIEEETSIEDEDILEYLNTIDNSSLLTEIES